MKKILIVCVNYNSYTALSNYLDSVESSAQGVDGLHLDVKIADNSSQKELFDLSQYEIIDVQIYEFNNLGYFGGASAIINRIDNIIQYQYVIISNVDVLFEKDTLAKLVEIDVPDDLAWVAQSTYSLQHNRDLNPSVLKRYSAMKLRLLRYTYNKYLYKFYLKHFYSKKNANVIFPKMDIYASHGACIILTSNFFKKYHTLNYPLFLYGEELYLAELISKANLKVVYFPDIRIKDIGKVSTSKLPASAYLKHNIDAINYILNEFY